MYTIVYKGTVLTRAMSFEEAQLAKKELLEHYFSNCAESELVIVCTDNCKVCD